MMMYLNGQFNSSRIKKTDLIINTSCEHMPPMKQLKFNWGTEVLTLLFTSNNMYDIEGHVNCVSCLDEFKEQLPDNARVISEDEISDERGRRFLIVGKYEKSNI